MRYRVYVYGLFDPDGELRYVGMTASSPEVRLRRHLELSALKRHRCHRSNWLLKLLNEGKKPEIRVIQELKVRGDLVAAEIYWIRFFKEQGCRLTNETSGGDGVIDPSPETRLRRSLAQKGIPKSLEARLRMSIASKGRIPWNKGLKGAQVAWNKGKTLSPEEKAVIFTPEYREKQSQGTFKQWEKVKGV